MEKSEQPPTPFSRLPGEVMRPSPRKQILKKPRKTTVPGKKNKPSNKPFEERFPSRTTPAAESLASNVRAMRERLELTQVELARAVGTDQAAISLIETARSNPTLQMIEAIAEALQTSAPALLSRPTRRRTGKD
jgi:DNA-binding XRE family transcriptional regulator